LAGIHNNRFKTFIAHDGVFTQSMFDNWRSFQQLGFVVRIKKDNAVAQKTYTTFNPINLVESGTRQYPLSKEEKISVYQ
jgi:hypothetical protein